MIYADHAATTKLSEKALQEMLPWLMEEYGNPSQLYSFSRKPKQAIEQSREIIASCINAEPDEIFFTSGGTESDNWALKSSMMANPHKRTFITSQIEHHAILNCAAFFENTGINVRYLCVNSKGLVSEVDLKQCITEDTGLVSVMLSNNEIGSIQPIKKLTSVAHNYGAMFHTDAVQAIGHIPINVKDLGIDLLSASGHKFNGPKGVGFLFIKKGICLSPFIMGGSQELGKRAGTENTPAIVGMAVALQENIKDLQRTSSHLLKLEQRILNILTSSNVDYIRNGAPEHVPGNISLSFKGVNGEMLLHRMDLKGICISTGSACDSVNTQISHVIKAIQVPEDYARGTIRISLGRNNTFEEVEFIGQSLVSILKGFQKVGTAY